MVVKLAIVKSAIVELVNFQNRHIIKTAALKLIDH